MRVRSPKAVTVPREVERAVARVLEEHLGRPVELSGIRVIPGSRWADLLSGLKRLVTLGRVRVRATTRRDRIYLSSRVSPEAFFADPRLLLHEYFHVVGQWNAGRMTHASYVANPRKWEREAEEFAARNLARFRRALRGTERA
jgi:hypothetical protein